MMRMATFGYSLSMNHEAYFPMFTHQAEFIENGGALNGEQFVRAMLRWVR